MDRTIRPTIMHEMKYWNWQWCTYMARIVKRRVSMKMKMKWRSKKSLKGQELLMLEFFKKAMQIINTSPHINQTPAITYPCTPVNAADWKIWEKHTIRNPIFFTSSIFLFFSFSLLETPWILYTYTWGDVLLLDNQTYYVIILLIFRPKKNSDC